MAVRLGLGGNSLPSAASAVSACPVRASMPKFDGRTLNKRDRAGYPG
jgi:hypothetical protein